MPANDVSSSLNALAGKQFAAYDGVMIVIRFPDAKSKRRALGYLPGRFSFKSWANGEMIVPESALPFLAIEGIQFFVEGPATYERMVPALSARVLI
jgi:hypothetical protein